MGADSSTRTGATGATRSGEEIQAALRAFITRWRDYDGTERAEAQTFLNELFACYGSDRQGVGARFEDFRTSAGFMDLHWPGVCIVEMKAPSRDVSVGRDQVRRYWAESSDSEHDVPAARWVVICSFRRFEVWEPGRFPSQPRLEFGLDELPDRYDALAFLSGPQLEPTFVEHHRELTTSAAERIAKMYQSLIDRTAAPPAEVRRFVMQAVWCLFAEDLGMLEGYPLQRAVQRLLAQPGSSSAQEIGYLFRILSQKGDHNRRGDWVGTRYVNGELFAQPAEVDLNFDELRLLKAAAEFDWRKVDPTIFGSLMEGVLGRERRWELGAHYTHEVDIMKIVGPTIVRPWRERIDALTSPTAGRALLDELCAFRVLDPACGCGNFLYVAYRELRGLEHELKERIRALAHDQGLPPPPGEWPYYPIGNLLGIDIERVAVLIARVTLWMGHRQMIELYGEAEPPLPLVDLSGVRHDDALRVEWPDTDAIIGNPPFLGSQWIRGALGDDYVDWLKKEFGVGVKDFCVYWFRKAHDHLRPGQRAGLVGTNSISQNRARSASLEYVTANGGVITDAVSSQKWPGEAKVHVSLVNWISDPAGTEFSRSLNGLPVEGISAALQSGKGDSQPPQVLAPNGGRCFQGPIPVGAGFILSTAEARALLDRDSQYRAVVRPFLTGEDITTSPTQTASRWTVDFGTRSLEQATEFPLALDHVRRLVKPERDHNPRKVRRERWWRFGEPAVGMWAALRSLNRYIVMNQVGKRPLFAWFDPSVCPNSKTNVFAFEDDYSIGVLTSHTHGQWAWARGGSLETRLSYTPTSVFMTFPWPDPATAAQRERVAEASRQLLARRSEICLAEQIGLTKLYNAVDDGAYTDLKARHRELDEAVADCYGWPRSVAQDDVEIVRRLTELNREISEGGRPYDPFAHLRAAEA